MQHEAMQRPAAADTMLSAVMPFGIRHEPIPAADHFILFVAFVDLIGFGLIIPLQAVYAGRLGASRLTFGLLVGVYATMQFVFNPLLGRWSDRTKARAARQYRRQCA